MARNLCLSVKKITYKYKKKRILLKSLVNTARIKYLLEVFPDAKFIHIYRDPYKVYLSTWKLYKKILPIFSFQHITVEELDSMIITVYREMYKKYLAEKTLIPEGNLIEISYENFIENPMKTLKDIYQKLEIDGFNKAKPAFEKYLKKHENYKTSKYSFNKELKEKIYREWEFVFKEFGYEK